MACLIALEEGSGEERNKSGKSKALKPNFFNEVKIVVKDCPDEKAKRNIKTIKP